MPMQAAVQSSASSRQALSQMVEELITLYVIANFQATLKALSQKLFLSDLFAQNLRLKAFTIQVT